MGVLKEICTCTLYLPNDEPTVSLKLILTFNWFLA